MGHKLSLAKPNIARRHHTALSRPWQISPPESAFCLPPGLGPERTGFGLALGQRWQLVGSVRSTGLDLFQSQLCHRDPGQFPSLSLSL